MQIERMPVEVIRPLRHRVLRPGLPAESAKFDGDDDPETIHLAVLVDREVVGCVTLLPNPLDGRPAWQLRGMAVDEACRNRGIGSAVLEAVNSALPFEHTLWCNARVPVSAFYIRHSWVTVSKPFDIPTVGPHVRMCRNATAPEQPARSG